MADLTEPQRTAWTVGAIILGLGVALGAFGSHGLERVVPDPHLRDVWDTAVRYQLIHGLALLLCGAHPRAPRPVVALFNIGILVFCGSLYALSLTGVTALGRYTRISLGYWADTVSL